MEERGGIFNSRGVADDGMGFDELGPGRGLQKEGVEKVPLKVGESKELGRGRHVIGKWERSLVFKRVQSLISHPSG